MGEIYRSAGEGVYKYRLHDPDDPAWHFADRAQWKMEIQRGCKYWDSSERKGGVADLAQGLLAANPLGLARAAGAGNPLPWLAGIPGASDCVEGPMSVMLNNVCRAESIQKFTYVVTFSHTHLTLELVGLKTGEPRWLYDKYRDEKQVQAGVYTAFPDRFVKPDHDKFAVLSEVEQDKTVELLTAFRILHECTVLGYQTLGMPSRAYLKIKVRDEFQLTAYERGRICWSLPIPGKPTKGSDINKPKVRRVGSPEVVVKSLRVAETLKHLSRIWQDRFVSSVLLTAPPGSGKENYALSIAFGTGRGEKPPLTVGLAAARSEDVERQLFGHRRDDGSICPGILAQAAGGTVFLDEVHQPDHDDGVRASLLRTLENEVYYPIGGTEEVRVQNVLFVLATSRRLKSRRGGSGKPLCEIPPTDFWTRMSHVVEIPHPFEKRAADSKDDGLEETVRRFFCHFWWDRAERVMEVRWTDEREVGESATKRFRREQLADLLKKEDLEGAGWTFSSQLLAALRRQRQKSLRSPVALSVRGVRSMVSALVSEAVMAVISGKKWYVERDFSRRCPEVIEGILKVALIRPKKA